MYGGGAGYIVNMFEQWGWTGAGRCPKFEQVGGSPCGRQGVRASEEGDFGDFPCS